MGKVDDNKFNVDFQYPFSALQAPRHTPVSRARRSPSPQNRQTRFVGLLLGRRHQDLRPPTRPPARRHAAAAAAPLPSRPGRSPAGFRICTGRF